jgi:subtilase family protein
MPRSIAPFIVSLLLAVFSGYASAQPSAREMLSTAPASRAAAVSNSAPSIACPSNAEAVGGGILQVSIVVSDPNPEDILVVTLEGLPEGFSATGTTGPSPLAVTISGRMPLGSDASDSLNVTWLVTDGVNPSVEAATAVSVSATPDPNLPQGAGYSAQHVLLWFRGGIVEDAPAGSKGSPDQFAFSVPEISTTLATAGVTQLTRLLPWFDHSSVLTNDIKGNPITLPEDLADLYIADIVDSDVPAAVAVLRTDTLNIRSVDPDYFIGSSSVPPDSTFQPGSLTGFHDAAPALTGAFPDDPFFSQQWHLQNSGDVPGDVPAIAGMDTRAKLAWNRTTGGATSVAVLSTGIDPSHPELSVSPGPNFVSGGSSADDDLKSAGTAAAGVIGAHGNDSLGVAGIDWDASVVSVKVLDANEISLASAAVQGVDWARASGIPIIYCAFRFDYGEDAIAAVFKNAHATGIFLAAGTGLKDEGVVTFPAALSEFTEGVGAITEDGTRWRASTDPTCPNPNGSGSPFGPQVKLSAPGGNRIVTTKRVALGSTYRLGGNCGFAWESGTAGAAACVSGVAALLRSFELSLYGEDIAQVLERTSRDLGPPGKDVDFGFGLVNAAAAIDFVDNGRVVDQGSTTNVYDVGETDTPRFEFEDVPGLVDNQYCTKKHEVRADVQFGHPFVSAPDTWGRKAHSIGWRSQADGSVRNHLAEPAGWAEVVPGSLTRTGCTLRAYVYQVFTCLGVPKGWYPVEPSQVRLAWTAIGWANPTAVGDQTAPAALSITPSPNPVKASGEFRVTLPAATKLALRLYRVDGTLAREIAKGVYPMGTHRFLWETAGGSQLAAGVYFYQLVTDGGRLNGKVMVLR